ncbi:MAG: trypsin-like peptidase domain-containing protein [Nitrospirota bacterium]|nr:trypsin-like peptidase domain-containing protein [Nitrospirota bacterium]
MTDRPVPTSLEVSMRAHRLALLTVLLTGWPWGIAAADTIRNLFKDVDGAVIVIQTNRKETVGGPEQKPTTLAGMGSGVLISSDGKVMTAAHLVQTADEVTAHFQTGEVVKAKVVTSDPSADVALLQLERVPPNNEVAKLGNSDAAEVGDQVFVVGAPLGLGHTLTVGHISARHRPKTMYGGLAQAEFFQTDAAINQGNSGGPMFNMAGEVIGIVSHIISKSGGFEGLGFVVTSSVARRLLLEKNPYWSGVEGFLLSGDLARVFNLTQPAGLLVQRISARSPAAEIGLRPGSMPAVIEGQSILVGGDVVLEVQGVPIVADGSSTTVIRDRLASLKSGDIARVTVLRGGEKKELTRKVP